MSLISWWFGLWKVQRLMQAGWGRAAAPGVRMQHQGLHLVAKQSMQCKVKLLSAVGQFNDNTDMLLVTSINIV